DRDVEDRDPEIHRGLDARSVKALAMPAYALLAAAHGTRGAQIEMALNHDSVGAENGAQDIAPVVSKPARHAAPVQLVLRFGYESGVTGSLHLHVVVRRAREMEVDNRLHLLE